MTLSSSRNAIACGLLLVSITAGICVAVLVSRNNANAGQTASTITIKAKDVQFVPDTISVKVGQPLTIRFENDDDMDHALNIDELNVQSDVIGPHQVTSVTFTPQQTGTYPFYCPMPGHAGLGMVGTLEVIP